MDLILNFSLFHSPNRRLKFFVHILLVETKLVQHTHQESILFFRVIFTFVRAVRNSQLMEWNQVALHLWMIWIWIVYLHEALQKRSGKKNLKPKI